MKEKNPNIRIVGYEPAASAVVSGGEKGCHKIVGVGPGFKTDNYFRAKDLLDEVITVSDEDAYEFTRLIPRKEGLLVGITSGAGVYVAEQLSKRAEYQDSSKVIVLFFCDSGERYLSTPNLFDAEEGQIDYSFL